MSGLGKVARGLASGLSKYYGEVARQEIEERKIRSLADRQMAIEAIKAENDLNRIDRQGEVNAGLEVVRTNQEIRKKRELLPDETEATIKVETRKGAIREAEAERDFLRDIRKLEVEFGYKVDEKKLEAGLQEARDAANDGRKVVATGVNAAGDVVVTYANNRVTTMRGMKPTPSGKADDRPRRGTGRPGDNGGNDGNPAPSSPSQGFDMAEARADLATVYPNATPERYPYLFRNGQKLSLEEALAELERRSAR